MEDTAIDTSLSGSVDYAWQAYNAADWAESYRRWERVRALFPDYEPPYIHGGASLLKAGRLSEAQAQFQAGFELFPQSAQLAVAIGSCLEQTGDTEASHAWFESQIARFPDHPEVAIDYIALAYRRQDYAALIRGAALMERVHPVRLAADEGVRHMISEGRLRHEMSRMDRPEAAATRVRARNDHLPAGATGDAELMLSFQSLGQNCEFGLTQRRFHAEPLGLLRWAAITVTHLTQALNESFEGVGSREQTIITEGGGEYATAHSRYGMGSHTFVPVVHENQDAVFEKIINRLLYLRRELIADLEEGVLTFVYACEDAVSPNEIEGLHQALRHFGSRYLLFVRVADADHPAGHVVHAGGGLMLGYIDKLGPDRSPQGDVWNISYACWLALLKTAAEIRRRDEAAPSAPDELRPATHPVSPPAPEITAPEPVASSPRTGSRPVEETRSRLQSFLRRAMRPFAATHRPEPAPAWSFTRYRDCTATLDKVKSAIARSAFAEAEMHLARARSGLGDDKFVLMASAEIAQAQGDWPEAQRRWQRVIDGYPDTTIAYAHRASTVQARGDFAGAALLYETLIKDFPEDVGAPISIVNLLEHLDPAQRARFIPVAQASLVRLTRIHPDYGILFLTLARLAKMRDDWQAAYTYLAQAQELDRGNSDIWKEIREVVDMLESRKHKPASLFD